MNKRTKISISLALMITTISTIFAFSVTNLNATHNFLNSNSDFLSTNLSTYNDNDSSMLMNNNQAKVASDADFLLDSKNAISLANPVEMQTSLSVANGPRGFISQSGTNLVYTGYDGKEIWTSNISTFKLISSYYDTKGYFVCLIGDNSDGTSINYSFKEEDGTFKQLRVWYVPNYKIYNDIEQARRTLMIPIKGSDSQYLVTFQTTNGPATGEGGLINRNYWIVQLNNDGSLSQKADSTINTVGWVKVFLGAGAITHNNVDYLITLAQYPRTNTGAILDVYEKPTNSNQIFQRISSKAIINLSANNINDNIINNIPEIYLSLNASNNIDITAILNFDTSKTQIISNQFDTSASAMGNNTIISLEQPLNQKLNYDIYKGRFYGDYLYAYLGTADYNGISKNRKIMRLNVSDQNDGTWNDNGLQWDGSYTNKRIVLYNSPYNWTNDALPTALGLPIYSTNYNGKNNLFSFCTYSADENRLLYLLDGTKEAFAYQTKLKTTSNNFAIANVSDTLVKDANSDLKTYFTNQMFSDSFTQYQSGSTWDIEKKTDSNSLIENNKGNIPATLNIYKGYDNNSIIPVKQSFDIVLTGFKEAPKTTDIAAPTTSINLPDVYPYQTLNNPTIEPTIKEFIINNILTGEVTDITVDNVLDYVINTYDNKQGQLILDSITLNKWYDDNGDVQNTNKTFTLANNAKIEINGFKVVNGATSAVTNDINITGDLAALTTSAVTEEQLQTWIDTNQASIIVNLPPEVNNITISNIIKKSSIGKISFDATISSYYEDDAWYTYNNNNKQFTNISLAGFTTQDLATTIKQPTIDVTGTLTNTLAQLITKENADFKQYLFDNVVVDPTKQLSVANITDFTGTYNNTTGTYLLTAISLDKTYDNDGNLLPPKTFNNLSYSIQGFKVINSTATISTILTIPGVNNISVLDNTVASIMENWLKTDLNFNQAFTNLPEQFNANNIISLSIVADSIVASTGSLKVNIVINKYYANDTIATLTTTNSTPFELSITGFKTDSLATSVNVDPETTTMFQNILAQSININTPDFKQYLFDKVLINPQNKLSINNITNITEVNPDNIKGTLSFKLTVDEWYDEDGNLHSSTKTFNEVITISKLRQINPTTLISNPFIPKGDSTILASDVNAETVLRIVKENYLTIFENLPDVIPNTFTDANIISVSNIIANNNLGQLSTSATVNLYYSTDKGLIKTDEKIFNNIIISGYQVFPIPITIKDKFDILQLESSYHLAIAESIITKGNLQLANNWLRNPVVFKTIFPIEVDNKLLNPNEFEILEIVSINNIQGEVTMKVGVTASGNNWVLENDLVTFFNFRKTISINTWITNINTLSGSASSSNDVINDIKTQIINKSDPISNLSPFENKLTANNIEINQNPNDKNKYIVKIVNTKYVNNNGNLNDATILPIGEFNITYTFKSIVSSNNDNSLNWLFPVIFSIVGLVALLLLIWIIIAIVRRKKTNSISLDPDNTIY